jgi:hypothetical protein
VTGQELHGCSFLFLADPEIAQRGCEVCVVHQVPQHQSWNALVGQGLGVGVADGMGVYGLAVEGHRRALLVGGARVDAGDGGDPGPHPFGDQFGTDMRGAVGVLGRPGQQPQ